MSKSADAFRTISEVAEWLETPAHVLRFWESKFTQVKPVKRAGGRRYYRPADMRLLGGIKKLLHEDGMTIKGVQKILREQGIKHVSSLCTLDLAEEEDAGLINAEGPVPASDPVDTVVPFAKPELEPDPETEDTPEAPDDMPAAAADHLPDAPAQPLDEAPKAASEDMPDVTAEAEPSGSGSEDEADKSTVEDATEPAEQGPADASAPEADPDHEDAATTEDTAPQYAEPVAEQMLHAAEPEVQTAIPETEVVAETPDAPNDPSLGAHPPEKAESESLPEQEHAGAGPAPADTPKLPGFVQHSIPDRHAKQETGSDAPESVAPASHVDPAPGVLSRLSRISHLSPEAARQIAPVLDQLRALSR